MRGFPLRTAVRTHYCFDCGMWTPQAKHECVHDSRFVRLVAGGHEYDRWLDAFAAWDAGSWNAAMNIQIAGIMGWSGAYVLSRDFSKHYHACLISERSYIRLKPSGVVGLQCAGEPHILYVNEDMSSALLPTLSFNNILEQDGNQYRLSERHGEAVR